MNRDGVVSVDTGQRRAWPLRLAGFVAVIWSLGFAAVSVWQLVMGPGEGGRLRAYAAGLATVVVMVLVLKLVGTVLAVAAVAPRPLGLPAPMSPEGRAVSSR